MNSDALKDFLFRHVEKFIFGTLVLLAVFLIYRGFQMPDYLREQQPDRMEQGANEVKTSIDVDHWEELGESRLVAIDVVARTNESIRPVNPQTYRLSPWEAKSLDTSIKREDPVIAAPIELLVEGVISAIAFKTTDPEYPLKKLENAELIEKAPEPKKKESRRRRPVRDPYGEEMMYDEEPEMEDYGMDGMDGMGDGGSLTPSRKIDKKYDLGFRPQGSTAELAPAMGHFIAGVALMPHRTLFSAFEEALQQADGYNARRDQPVYVGYQLQRADVTEKDVDQLTDKDWINRFTSKHFQLMLLRQWAGMAKEIVTGKYRDPNLTSAIPPVLLTHYSYFSSHPKIPLGDEDPRATQRQLTPQRPTGPVEFDPEADLFARQGRIDPLRQLMQPGGMGGGYGYGMMMPRSPFGAATAADQAEHKLIRFYDFRDFSGRDQTAPQPGRRYVYRIRVLVEDPNFPREPAAKPRNSTLSADVFQRVQKLEADAKKTNQRIFYRYSEYSAPSPVVSLPPTTMVYAGPVTPPTGGRPMQLDGREVTVGQKSPIGKLVIAQWDKKYQVPVPVFMDVVRGSVVAKKGDFDVPDPLSLVVKKLPETTVNTQTVVLDMGGGRPLAISPGDNQTEPSMMLLFDAEGGLRVVDEVDSQQGYRLYSYADDRGK